MMPPLSRLTRRAASALLLVSAGLSSLAILRGRGFLRSAPPLTAPLAPLRSYHLGHSLVGADMPHMLHQFAGKDHLYHVQRGSGTSLRAHWEPDEPILHFAEANPREIWRDARTAIGSGTYDAVILTEMVELRDALKYFDAAEYFHRWADLARAGNPDVRLYLYETWHRLDDPEGWLTRIDRDLDDLWLGKLLSRDSRRAPDQPVYLIPGGQVLAAVTRAAEAGEVPGLTHREALFAREADGSLDQIHLSPLGSYLIALTHFAVLYHRTPEGLPHQVTLADGTPFTALDTAGAAALQRITWQVLTRLPQTGLVASQPTSAETS